jgi:alkanesulfonate monooxygenase SsuD/methylene tetrahydromethanopterin reductase-like flavin-dependent oxidoreductase (luciferase family)
MNGEPKDRAIREGIQAAEFCADFARDSMTVQFNVLRQIADRPSPPPAVQADSWAVLNAIVAETEQESRELERGLTARAIDQARWLCVPVPTNVAALAVNGEEED